MPRRPLLLIVDTAVETLDMLRAYFEHHSYDVATLQVRQLREGQRPAAEMITAIAPRAIIFDVALPYEENWRFLQDLQRAVPAIPFVVTTTNERAVEQLTGAHDVIEILGKPYDLAHVLRAVERALDPGAEKPSGGRGSERRVGVDRRAGDRRHHERRHRE